MPKWCFTLNNPTEEPLAFIQRCSSSASITACVFQTERGNSGTLHWQGYLETKVSRPFNFVKRFINGNPHLEKRQGTAEQAIAYCQKEDTRVAGPWECGTFTATKTRGQRTDIEALVDTMQKATSLKEVVQAHPKQSIRYSRGIQFTYSHLKAPTEHKVPEVWLLYGPTGTGKTRYAMAQNDPFKKSGSSPWFDGYDHSSTLIFDDFGGKTSRMPLTDVLNYTDRYPVKLPVKGNFVDRNCDLLIITTNIHPQLWYEYDGRQAHYKALARRFTRILYFNDDGAYEQTTKSFFDDWVEHTGDRSLSTDADKKIRLPWEVDIISDDSQRTPPLISRSPSPVRPQLIRTESVADLSGYLDPCDSQIDNVIDLTQ